MKRDAVRNMALLLIPCLLVDPRIAHAITPAALSPAQRSPTVARNNLFQEQAVVAYLASSARLASAVKGSGHVHKTFRTLVAYPQWDPEYVESHARAGGWPGAAPSHPAAISGGWVSVVFGGMIVKELLGHAPAARKSWPELASRVHVISRHFHLLTRVPSLKAARTKQAIEERDAAYFKAAENTVKAGMTALFKWPGIFIKGAAAVSAAALITGLALALSSAEGSDLRFGGTFVFFAFSGAAALALFYMAFSSWFVRMNDQEGLSKSIQQVRYYHLQYQWAKLRDRKGFRTTEDVWHALTPGRKGELQSAAAIRMKSRADDLLRELERRDPDFAGALRAGYKLPNNPHRLRSNAYFEKARLAAA